MNNVLQSTNHHDLKKLVKKLGKNLNEFVIIPIGLLAMLMFL